MNYSTAVFLINQNVRAVVGTYEAEDNAKRTIFKTLDPSIQIGDFVVVPTDTRHKMTVVKIVETDVDVDFDNPTQLQWVIAPIDKHEYDQVLKQEQTAIGVVKSAELRKKRDDLREAMFKDHTETLKTLEIAAMPEAQKPIEQPAKATEPGE